MKGTTVSHAVHGESGSAGLSTDSRFDLAYNAAHALSLAALRKQGFRSDNRYLVFHNLYGVVRDSDELWNALITTSFDVIIRAVNNGDNDHAYYPCT